MLVPAADHASSISSAGLPPTPLRQRSMYAQVDHLVTFGIVPNYPGNRLLAISSAAMRLEEHALIRSPALSRSRTRSAAQAPSGLRRILLEQRHVRMFRAKSISPELAKFRPDILEARTAAVRAADSAATLSASALEVCSAPVPTESGATGAVMERPPMRWWWALDADWSDVGSWSVRGTSV